MSEYSYHQVDFENPSFLFALEDVIKYYFGGPLFYNKIVEGYHLRGDENVLDFGCGGGGASKVILRHLNSKGHLTCLDISRHWIAKVRKRLGNNSHVHFYDQDIRTADLPDESFDVISIVHVIHDIPPNDRGEVVKALAKKLKHGGKIHLVEPIKVSHGMAVQEIRDLHRAAGLKELDFDINKSRYQGVFQKD